VTAAQATRSWTVLTTSRNPDYHIPNYGEPNGGEDRTVTIPFAFQKDEEAGRVGSFIRAAQPLSNRRVQED
jgi:hypothetical protein